MYLGCFCLSPSHLILFPITITIEPEKKCVFALCFYKKMKKSVAPLSLKEPVQGVRKCILPDFLKLFDRLRYCITEKNFLIFSRKNYYPFPKRCNTVKTRLWNIPLKTASFQRLYFNFHFKIRNVTYILHFYFLLLQQKTAALDWLRLSSYLIVY